MPTYFSPKRDFHSLTVQDLLEAREHYHRHLTNLENVRATAVGRFLIRNVDLDSNGNYAYRPSRWQDKGTAPARTLDNSRVRPWSWPCILVFVDQWQQEDELMRKPENIVPSFLYLPDGRVIPTCVVQVEKRKAGPPPIMDLTFPDQLIGGGYPVITNVQNGERIASVGCLVSDGGSIFALTNRHVTGIEHRPIFSFLRGKRVRIGETAENRFDQPRNLGKKLFSDVYPGWPGLRTYVNLDAGMIRVDDVNDWTAQVYGVGEMGLPVDLHTGNITLELVGCPVRAFGGVSGDMRGRIKALFYRYRSVGGFDYVSDIMIGPRNEGEVLNTREGDSGTVWFFDADAAIAEDKNEGVSTGTPAGAGELADLRPRPLALQWGGQAFVDSTGEGQFNFGLATNLSTVCRELDVDVVPDWNIGHNEYWGKTGHYKIAAKACELIKTTGDTKKLATLLEKNVSLIGFTDQSILAGDLGRIDSKVFVPLADVSDLVWRTSRKLDSSNHFADMDQPCEAEGNFKGKTLLDLTTQAKNVDITVWNEFYEALGMKAKDRGALPFRVWQIFNEMVIFAGKGQVNPFVCAGGIVSHYVGDSCQPLHVSFLHHGRAEFPAEERVHSVYETQMLDRFSTDVIAAVNQAIGNRKGSTNISSGKDAAIAVIKLMRKTIDRIPPMEVIDAFNAFSGKKRLEHMWEVLGDRTAANIADGCVTMASIWSSAWVLGSGKKIPATKIKTLRKADLVKLYNRKTFLEAFRLDDPNFAAGL